MSKCVYPNRIEQCKEFWLANVTLPNWHKFLINSGLFVLFSSPINYSVSYHLDSFITAKNKPALIEAVKLLEVKGIVRKCHCTQIEFISHVFTIVKPNGSHRLVANVKKLNTFVKKEKFKLDTVKQVMLLMDSHCWMQTTDLKDAFNAVPLHKDQYALFRFIVKNQHYEFTRMPFGISIGPWVFTKLLKPVIGYFRELGINTLVYLDDFIIISKSFEQCLQHSNFVRATLVELGFVLSDKSLPKPVQQVQFLGVNLNSVQMSVSLPLDKINKISNLARNLLEAQEASQQELHQLLGYISFAILCVTEARLYSRGLQMLLIPLQINASPMHKIVPLSDWAIHDLQFWSHLSRSQCIKDITPLEAAFQLYTDSSAMGWGAWCQQESLAQEWTSEQQLLHINVKELLAVVLALQHFAPTFQGHSVMIITDNMVTLHYIRKQGGTKSPQLIQLAIQVWEIALKYSLQLQVQFIPTALNTKADYLSRLSKSHTEWKLDPLVAQQLIQEWRLTIDLFASEDNHQMLRFVTWRYSKNSVWMDAFSHSWVGEKPYVFPPYKILLQVLDKISRERIFAVVVAPNWPTQVYYTKLRSMLVAPMKLLPDQENLLRCPLTGNLHPLGANLQLAAWPIQG